MTQLNSIKFCILASGSRGNCIWIEGGDTALLVDCGLSGKETMRRIAAAGLDKEKIKAVIVSHEHRDHIQGAGILSRKLKIPVYLNEKTYKAAKEQLGTITRVSFDTGSFFQLGDFRIHPFSVSHDAADTVGFTFYCNGVKLGLATDLGTATNLVKERLAGSNGLILEFNHDPKMLWEGPYPWETKRRVQGRTGHLSNEDSAELLNQLAHLNLRQVVAAHLSQTNNHPDLALEQVRAALKSWRNSNFTAAEQDSPTDVFELHHPDDSESG